MKNRYHLGKTDTGHLLAKYKRLSHADLSDADRYADKIMIQLNTDIAAFQQSMVQNWGRRFTDDEIARLKKLDGRWLVIESFCAARNHCLEVMKL